jgi:hypothetical protein
MHAPAFGNVRVAIVAQCVTRVMLHALASAPITTSGSRDAGRFLQGRRAASR